MTTLRRAGPADADDLTRLRAVMHLAMGSEPTPAWERRTAAAFGRRLATEDFAAWLVVDGGRAVACGVGWLEEHLPSPHQLDPRRGHVSSMSTGPAARRRGHGRAVFAALMGWFADLGIERVDLRATDDGRPMYEAFGFQALGGATLAWFAPGTRPGMPA